MTLDGYFFTCDRLRAASDRLFIEFTEATTNNRGSKRERKCWRRYVRAAQRHSRFVRSGVKSAIRKAA